MPGDACSVRLEAELNKHACSSLKRLPTYYVVSNHVQGGGNIKHVRLVDEGEADAPGGGRPVGCVRTNFRRDSFCAGKANNAPRRKAADTETFCFTVMFRLQIWAKQRQTVEGSEDINGFEFCLRKV